jgi:Zn-dependent M28 family amino/carboxypeptidase
VQITTTALGEWLELIVGERHLTTSLDHHEATRGLIRETFVTAGLEVSEQPVPGPLGTGHNVIGRLPGTHHPERTWILGAHYDTVEGTPGADDNGVAVAGLLETAKALAGLRPRDSVELVAWDLEEPQTLLTGIAHGSREMARRARETDRVIGGVVVLEMIGYRRDQPGTQAFPPGLGLILPQVRRWLSDREDRADFIAAIGNRRSQHVLDALSAASAARELPLIPVVVRGPARFVPDFYRSDHAPFWRSSYPAVMVTDTAEFRSPHYHRPSDTVDTLDLDFAASVMGAAAQATLDLAGLDGNR